MSVKVSTWAWEMPLKSNEKLVLLALADHANDEGKCWPHIERIAEKCGLCRSAVIENLKKLHQMGFFTKETVYSEFGGKKGNLYILNIELSPESIRMKSIRSESIHMESGRVKSGSTPPLSPDSGPIIIVEPSMNHHEPSKTMSDPDGSDPPDKPSNSFFEQFWKIYPRHEKKKHAREIWQRKKLDGRAELILADVEKRLREHSAWQEGFIPHASTYLAGERWNDEIKPRASPPKKYGESSRNKIQRFEKKGRQHDNFTIKHYPETPIQDIDWIDKK